jgi:DNA polymerase I
MDKNLEQNTNSNDSIDTREASEILRVREQAIQSAPRPKGAPSVERTPAAEEIYSQVLDPFDPKNHKKPQDPRLNPGADPAVCALPNVIEARKPKKSWFIRIHPDPAYRVVLPLYIDEDAKRRDSSTYLFDPGLEIPPDMEGLVRDTFVAAAITSAGICFLYILTVFDNSWYESGLTIIQHATEEWVRVYSAEGEYVFQRPIATLEEPRFPDAPFREWLERAFSKRLIKSLDDPLMELAELQGSFKLGVWLFDTEYATPHGDPVIPVCIVGREFFTGQCIRQFFDQGQTYENPFPMDDDAVFVAYAAQAEWSCLLSLGWRLPTRIIDLYAEFRNQISGRTPPSGYKAYDARLIGAMDYYGLDRIAAVQKKEMQERISRGHPFTMAEREAILEYCGSDVECLDKLLRAVMPTLELPYALFRGRYTKAVARMERLGIPVDGELYEHVFQDRELLKSRLIARYETHHGPSPYIRNGSGTYVFTFRKLEAYIDGLGLLPLWEKTSKNRLTTREEYLQEMARKHILLQPLADLVKRVGDLRQFGLTIGSDSRARYPVMPFKADTGRNQPKAKRFLFAQSSWTRAFVKPRPGYAVAYIDWHAAEFAIAAQISQDPAMQKAYDSGDPYLNTAISMGFANASATRHTDSMIRDVFKVWLLSAQYGATANSLVGRLPAGLVEKIPNPLALAEEFLEKHHRLYTRYWEWAEKRVELFVHETHMEETLFGWRHHLNTRLKDWQIRNQSLNFPMQSTCAEVLRWACVYATEDGIDVPAPVHDALLVEGPAEEIEEIVWRTQGCMDRASELVLGYVMRTDAKIIRYPDRFMDPRGAETWNSIMNLLNETDGEIADSTATVAESFPR